MLKLFGYLKRSWIRIVAILLLLGVQAACDLSLPGYTSDIVNVGIQQGGIESATPEVIRASEMERLTLFWTEEEREQIENAYELLNAETLSSDQLSRYQAEYPALETETLYRLQDTRRQAELSPLFARAIVAYMGVTGQLEGVEDMPANLTGSLSLEQLAALPEEQQTAVVGELSRLLDALPSSILEQVAVSYVRSEYATIGIDVDARQISYLWISGAKMLGLALASMAATVLVVLLASRVSASLGQELRSRTFKKVVGFSNRELEHFSTASLITRSTNDIQQIQLLMVMLLRIVFYAPIIGVGGVIRALDTNPSMAWIILVAVLAMLALVVVLFLVAMPRFKSIQRLIDRVNQVSREILTGLPVIRAFSAERHEEKRFDAANRDLTRTNLFVNRTMSLMMPIMMLVMNGATILIVWFGASGVDQGAMQVGDIMAFIQYTMMIIMAFLMISMVSIMLPRASVSAARIVEVLNSETTIHDPESPKTPDPAKKGEVTFSHVSFRYPGAEEDVLHDISFTARPGETTAIIGSTGSGKSTLVNLIPRFYDVTEGEILVEGVDVRQMRQHDLHAKLGYVPQRGVLFSGTIASNIRYGKGDLPDSQVEEAAQIAQAADFIEAKPDGYDSAISQGGANVSGGQKQRLSIARAIAGRPPIYIFDDSFSALDFKTDAALRRALSEKTAGSTVILVAQRISTVLHAQQIIVLDEGRIVGKGTHEELMESSSVYRQICLSQLSKEELNG